MKCPKCDGTGIYMKPINNGEREVECSYIDDFGNECDKGELESKVVVWDLFGGLNGSVGKAIGYEHYDIYTLDILPKTKDGRDNIVVNLGSDDINEIYKVLDTLPKPNIIVASPMCNSFSSARRYKDGGTGAFVINEDKSITPRDYESWLINRSEKRHDKWNGVKEKGELGITAIKNTCFIIGKYNPNYWYIENPKTSLMWNYLEYNVKFDLKNDWIKNLAYYSSYGHFAKKPTYFLSNINLDLKTNKHISSGKGIDNIQTKDRSNIPAKLIQDIFEQFKEK